MLRPTNECARHHTHLYFRLNHAYPPFCSQQSNSIKLKRINKCQLMFNCHTHHIQECLLKGRLRCIMALLLGIPGHCPGFISRLRLDTPTDCSPFTWIQYMQLPTYTVPHHPQAPAQRIASHTAIHSRDAPICTSLILQSSLETRLSLGITTKSTSLHCKRRYYPDPTVQHHKIQSSTRKKTQIMKQIQNMEAGSRLL